MNAPESVNARSSFALVALLELSRRARQARSEAELGFMLVNDTVEVTPYRQAALWFAGPGVKTLSGLVQPELNAPYTQWLKAVCQHLQATPPAEGPAGRPRPFTSADLPERQAADWAEWWPGHALWLPMPGEGPAMGALVLVREEPWTPGELALLGEWTAIWWHALLALRRSRKRSLLAPWRRDLVGAQGPVKPWWRRPVGLLALALVAAAFVPMRLSVLAPGELVPRNPVVVRAPLEGVVDVFHVVPNQVVQKGQPLFGFDEALIRSRVEVAEQALVTSDTEYRQTLQRALADPSVRPQLAVLQGRIEEKRAEVDYQRDQLSRAQVLAPRDGVVLFDDPTEWIGRPVTIGERILRIAAPDDVEVEAWLPIGDAITLEPGAEVNLFLNAEPLKPVRAKLRYIAHDAVARPDGTFAYRVRATLDGETAHRVGLKGTAKLHGERVLAAYWVMRRPIATVRSTLGL